MSPLAAIGSVFRNYFRFRGRARRSEYWWFVVVRGAVYVALCIGVEALDADGLVSEGSRSVPQDVLLSAIIILLLGTIIPDLTVTVRRLHDADRSGTWFLLAFVPMIGWLLIAAMAADRGTRGPNRFGHDPRSIRTATSTPPPVQEPSSSTQRPAAEPTLPW